MNLLRLAVDEAIRKFDPSKVTFKGTKITLSGWVNLVLQGKVNTILRCLLNGQGRFDHSCISIHSRIKQSPRPIDHDDATLEDAIPDTTVKSPSYEMENNEKAEIVKHVVDEYIRKRQLSVTTQNILYDYFVHNMPTQEICAKYGRKDYDNVVQRCRLQLQKEYEATGELDIMEANTHFMDEERVRRINKSVFKLRYDSAQSNKRAVDREVRENKSKIIKNLWRVHL